MPMLDVNPVKYTPRKDLVVEWDTWRKGLNLLLRPTELGRDEMAQADNIILTGSGVPTGRWGTLKYFTANATGTIRGFGTYQDTLNPTTTNELITVTDQGYLAKKNGTTSTTITGQSYPSGSTVRFEQLGGKTYIVSKDVPLTTYNGTAVSVFATLSAPTGVTATNFSGASGTSQWSWKLVTVGVNGGQTTASTNYVLNNLPYDLTRTSVKLFWTAPSAAASTINGFEIYRGLPGDETYLAAVGPSVTQYQDFGDSASETILAPITNTTGGVKSEFITKFNDRIVCVDAADPTKLLISGRYPNQGKFSWADGGGYVYVDPDSGSKITAIDIQQGSDYIIVWKEFSSYAVKLNVVTIGNYAVLDPSYQPISTAVGCSSQDTVQRVENDVFYFGRKGMYVVGYEPNFLNLIRTNEISARVRPYLAQLNDDDYKTANAMYVDNKYILSFPLRKEMLVYDRERGSFAGIWKLPFGISHMKKWVDTSGTERWVIGSSESNQVYTFESSVNSDDGQIITKTIRTNKEKFNTWSLLKILKLFYFLFRNIKGEVNVNILLEDRNGTTKVIKTFTVSGSATSGTTGWGVSLWGGKQWGLTSGSITTVTDEIPKWGQLFKQCRLVQIEISCTAAASNFEWLGAKMTATAQQEGSLPASQRV